MECLEEDGNPPASFSSLAIGNAGCGHRCTHISACQGPRVRPCKWSEQGSGQVGRGGVGVQGVLPQMEGLGLLCEEGILDLVTTKFRYPFYSDFIKDKTRLPTSKSFRLVLPTTKRSRGGSESAQADQLSSSYAPWSIARPTRRIHCNEPARSISHSPSSTSDLLPYGLVSIMEPISARH